MLMWRPKIQLHVLECLGEGGQGRVHKALRLDKKSGLAQFVAVKILHSKTAIELWKVEFQSLAQVRSPYCVQVLAFERVLGRPSLILELVDGLSLTDLVKHSRLTDAAITEILAQTQQGLCDLAAHGLFHGDLSPGNVLVDVSGRIRLLDFGMANGSGDGLRLTPAFAAPERLSGHTANLASDLFSLGRLEQFLRQLDPDIGNAESPYLRLLPDQLQLLPHKPDRDRQQILAEQVKGARRQMRLKAELRTCTQGPKAKPASALRLKNLAAGCFLSVFCALSGAAQNPRQPALATLSLRTQAWHRFTLDGRPLGYSPVDVVIGSGATHRLEWASAKNRGVLMVRLASGRKMVLNDRDFSH